MPSNSPAKLIQDALHGILVADSVDLMVDSRTVTIIKNLPGDDFSQRSIPLVAIGRPSRVSVDPWSITYERHTYNVPIRLLDTIRVGPDERQVTDERLSLLLDKVRTAFKARRSLDLSYLHVFESLCAYEEGDPSDIGNNLAELPVAMTVFCIVAR